MLFRPGEFTGEVFLLERIREMENKTSRRDAWRLLIALGVVLVAGLACQIPTSGNQPTVTSLPPTALPVSTNTVPANPAPTNTTSSPGGPEVSEVEIYLIGIGDGGSSGKPVGCGDSLVAIKRPVAPTRQPIVAALNELFTIKQQYFGESGLYTALYQSNLSVDSAQVNANGVATVVLTGQVLLGGTCDTPRFKGQIEETILAVEGVQSANILLNGEPIDEALSQR